MAPPGVSIHASRVPYNHDARSFAESPNVDTATERLVGLAPHVIVYAYTGSSYVLGAEADDALRVRLEKRARGIPVVLTTSAASEALGLLRVHRLALIHPPWFSEEVNTAGKTYFQSRGVDVIYCARMTPGRRFMEVPPAEVYTWAKANVPDAAEGLLIADNVFGR
jgi:maleate isomerase